MERLADRRSKSMLMARCPTGAAATAHPAAPTEPGLPQPARSALTVSVIPTASTKTVIFFSDRSPRSGWQGSLQYRS